MKKETTEEARDTILVFHAGLSYPKTKPAVNEHEGDGTMFPRRHAAHSETSLVVCRSVVAEV